MTSTTTDEMTHLVSDDIENPERNASIVAPPFPSSPHLSRSTHVRTRRSSVHALAAAEQIREEQETIHLRHSIVDIRSPDKPSRLETTYGATVDMHDLAREEKANSTLHDTQEEEGASMLQLIASQIPAIIIASVLNFMMGIPFGASYFPVGWSSTGSTDEDGAITDDDVHGAFPLGGKEALGLRMFLFSTAMAQTVFTIKSRFDNGIGLQMVENVPFCLELAHIVIDEQGYGMDSLSTLFFIFGFSSVLVGLVFYLLGHFKLGRVVYFFPSHVLLGCIGGIGAFIIITGIEVTTNTTFQFSLEGLHQTFIEKKNLVTVVLVFEVVLRLLIYFTRDANGKQKFPLLGPIYYCAITPIFYIVLAVFNVGKEEATDAGYFFPPLESCTDDCDNGNSSSLFDDSLFDVFTVVNLTTISWKAVVKSIPTVISLVAFSLIHVPINIPAFAISTNVEPDMDAELVAHGWSNAVAGVFGGLQNYMCYCNSVIFAKSGGKGKASSLGIVGITVALFVVGPTMAAYVPRCMAGTLLLHIGIDLFLEGVYDSYGDYDILEYSGIWLITVVMVVFGMSSALIAGAVAALSTYAVQSITHQKPIKGTMSAASLRSSAWDRHPDARAILSDKHTGRHRILLIQLQGHIFFGNAAIMTDAIKSALLARQGTVDEPKIVILDFTPVLGLDSSAAQAIAKLKNKMHSMYNVVMSIFVTGCTEGFPCEFNLSKELSEHQHDTHESSTIDALDCIADETDSATLLAAPRRRASSDATGMGSLGPSIKEAVLSSAVPTCRVSETLDEALVFAEDVLIAMVNPFLLQEDMKESSNFKLHRSSSTESALDEENLLAFRYLSKLCPAATEDEVEELLSLFTRQKYTQGAVVWTQGSTSDSAKLLLRGELLSTLEDGTCVEDISVGSTIGELGLVHGTERLTTVTCESEVAILLSISRERWEAMLRSKPGLSKHIFMLVVRHLAHRVQHVSNRVLESRSLPI